MGTAAEIREQVVSGRRTAADVLADALGAIERANPTLNAFITVTVEHARRCAERVDAEVAAGRNPGVLAGVPVALKDNMCCSWCPTTCGSAMLSGYRSPYDATVVQRLEAAGAVIVGKTNLDEFAMGSSTQASCFGATRNPWDLQRVAGGSSGGSAAAVAAGLVPLALGSDTGGSIRQPASFCNVVGLKPSYGCVSRYGLVAFGSSLDQIGPLTRTAEDAALALSVIAGWDVRDSTSIASLAGDGLGAAQRARQSLRIGVSPELFGSGLDDEVRVLVESAVHVFREHGAQVIEVSMPSLPSAVACYYIVCTAEASSNLARFAGVHYGHRTQISGDIIDLYRRSRTEGFGEEVRRRIMLGTYVLSSGYYDAYYLKALKVRALIKLDFDRAFQRVDVLLSPTSPIAPFKLGDRLDDPLAMYLTDVYTVAANLAGICAISVPCGFTASGLPVGMQLQAPALAEQSLLQAAGAYQSWTDWHRREPKTSDWSARDPDLRAHATTSVPVDERRS